MIWTFLKKIVDCKGFIGAISLDLQKDFDKDDKAIVRRGKRTAVNPCLMTACLTDA